MSGNSNEKNLNVSYLKSFDSAPKVEEKIIQEVNKNNVPVQKKVESFCCSSAAFDLNYNSQLKNSDQSFYNTNSVNLNDSDKNESLLLKSKKKKPRFFSSNENNKYIGPWESIEYKNEDYQEIQIIESDEFKTLNENKTELLKKDEDKMQSLVDNSLTVSTFLGKERFDYQERSWMICPNEIKERLSNDRCYIPKKLITVLKAHTMGVQSIRYIPITGHLMLSASLDSQIRIWNVIDNNKCMYIYHGHNHAVRDIQFSNEKRNCDSFYSCGYDKQTILWDIEYGKIKWKKNNDKTPYCVSVYPNDERCIIVGYSNKKAIQYDIRSEDIVQEYAEHQGAVNSVTFCENGKKFVTTSDDKKMFVWDYGIPIVVKHIADPLMQSMPYVTLHPNKQHLICQSMDNKILVYDTHSNYKCIKKRFLGLKNSGYAIQCDVSPDGQFLISGDLNGKLHFWDWKTTKIFRSIQAHDGVNIACQWHPIFPSRIATCGWDGTIKIWD